MYRLLMADVQKNLNTPKSEIKMKTQRWIRHSHRWLSLIFTSTVVANFIAMALTKGAPPAWVTYLPLLPLLILMVTGLYLFTLPYIVKWRT